MGCFGRAQHAPTSPRSHTPHSLQFFLACHPKPSLPPSLSLRFRLSGYPFQAARRASGQAFHYYPSRRTTACAESESGAVIYCFCKPTWRKGRTLSLPSNTCSSCPLRKPLLSSVLIGRAQHAPTNPHSLQFFYLCSTTT